MVQVGPIAAAIQGAETTMPALFRTIVLAALAAALVTPDGAAFAGLGQPSPWQIGLQQSATPVMDDIVWFHDLLLWVIGAILGVAACLAGLTHRADLVITSGGVSAGAFEPVKQVFGAGEYVVLIAEAEHLTVEGDHLVE